MKCDMVNVTIMSDGKKLSHMQEIAQISLRLLA